MALPKSKQGLADYMLRRCGAPVVNVEVSDVQLEDCIDDAVKMYQEYHYDGNERTYRVLEVNAKLIAENQRRERERLAREKQETSNKLQSRQKARRGGSRLLLNAFHGGMADMTGDMTGLKDTLGPTTGT